MQKFEINESQISHAVTDRNLVETLKCFKVIGNCLKEIYAGETYMCRVLSVQLRMLLCDYSNKSEPLLLRLDTKVWNYRLLSMLVVMIKKFQPT